MSERVEIEVEGKDGLSRPMRSAADSLGVLQSSARRAHGILGSLGSMLGSVASSAAGFGAAMLGMRALDFVTGSIGNVVGGMIGMNSQMESMSQSFNILLSDAAAMGGGVEAANDAMATSTGGAASSMINAQERMMDTEEDHTLTVAKLAEDFARLEADTASSFANIESDASAKLAGLAADYAEAMGSMSTSHSRTMDGMRRQLEDLGAEWARQSAERLRRFEEEQKRLQDRYKEQAKTAPERFLGERAAAERNAKFLEESIAAEEEKGKDADTALLASLRTRLAQEQSLQKRTFTTFAAEEKAQQDAAVAAARDRYNQDEAEARASNDRRVAALQARMAEEDTQYAAAMARRKADYEKDLLAAKSAEDEKLAALRETEAERKAALQERATDEERSYARSVRDATQAMQNVGASYGKTLAKQTVATGTAVNQMQQMFDNLATYVGHPLATAEDRTAAMLEFIKRKAKETPFDIPDIQKTVQRLIAYQLDATQFLDTVGNVAAGMGVPVQQAADAFGALATGQMGEAVMRFREFGVNLKGIAGLKFDAQGALVTPTEEALARVKEALDTRFGGMMAAQAKTWQGMTSNMRDAWGQFLIVVGKPVFEKLEEGLRGLLGWIDENQEKLTEFGETLGKGLADALVKLGPLAQDAMTGLLDWISSGRAKEDVQSWLETAGDILGFLLDAIKLGGDFVGWLKNMADWMGENKVLVGGILVALGLLAAFLGGPLVWAFLAVTAGWVLLKEPIMDGIEGLKKGFGDLAKEAGDKWASLMTTMGTLWTGFKRMARDAMNAVIGFLNMPIKAWNDMFFELPGIEIGGLKFGPWRLDTPDVPTIPSIPEFDRGGIVRGPTLAALAMNGRPEAVVPLDRGSIIDYDRLAQALTMQPIILRIDGEEIVVRGLERARMRGRI